MSESRENLERQALRIELAEIGASMIQRQLFETNVDRARAAIARAFERGAGNVASYAVSLFKSETFMPDPSRKSALANVHGRTDPTRTEDGERIWQAGEVDDTWRHGYLGVCITALDERWPLETPGELARYAPSSGEWQAWSAAMKRRMPELLLDPARIRHTAANALDAWAEVWGFDDLRVDDDPEPDPVDPDPEPAAVVA